MDVLAILGDAVWIFVMATMAAAIRTAWSRVPPGARVPLWSAGGEPRWRVGRGPAFGLTLALPLVFGLALSATARGNGLAPDERLLLLLVRLATAPLFALAHMMWLRMALRVLQAEGTLKP